MTTKLKITAIKPYPVWVGTRNQMLVKVETDQGIYGWGESGLSGREKAVAGAIEHYREFLIGRDPMQIGRIWQEVYRSQYFEGGRVLQAAISAIDIALHDIKGKALGAPVYQLLGGKQRDRIPTFASTGDEAENCARRGGRRSASSPSGKAARTSSSRASRLALLRGC
jgi:galactonate dehydratase